MTNLARILDIISNKKAQRWLGFFVIFLFIGCGTKTESVSITGFTMGTTYSIKIINDSASNLDSQIIKYKIDSVLIDVNQQMSTYIDDSEISLFNIRLDNDWQNISNEFYYVLKKSLLVSKITNGAFDITVGPLMDLWGFGNSNQNDWEPPSDDNVSKNLLSIGFKNIEIDSNSIRKLNSNTIIDLNAIAKGFGVDVVFELLNGLGFKHILVEIGGEIRCSGKNQNGENWRVGIDKPIFDILPGTDLQELISLNNCALATSGDYRNYFYYNDLLYSHTINPITGYPVENGIASASVIASNCMLADALATALMVMGVDGLQIIEKLEGVDALIVERISEMEFKSVSSSGWNSD